MTANDRRQKLRTTLLDCAERIVAARGLPALKARDLAQEAGCALGAIYNVFPDLDTLILEVNLRTLAVFETYIERARSERRDRGAPAQTETAISDLIALGLTYLAFATDHPMRWRALFQHRLEDDRQAPDWYVSEQTRLFSYIEQPLGALCGEFSIDERRLMARTLFSATHGVVSLGLDKKLLALPIDVLKAQLEVLVRATAVGLANGAQLLRG